MTRFTRDEKREISAMIKDIREAVKNGAPEDVEIAAWEITRIAQKKQGYGT